MTTVTQWFEGEVKPVHVGAYQRDYSILADTSTPDYWNGECWHYGSRGEDGECIRQLRRWRGLAEKPQP